jgi:uncharacterized damage-inducible protein DinB
MNTIDIRDLYDFNAWANRQILAALRPLSSDEFQRDFGISFGSIQGTATHIVGSEWIWLDRFVTGNYTDFMAQMKEEWNTEKIRDAATLESRWESLDGRWRDFMGSLTDESLQTSVKTRGGDIPLSKCLQHILNHSTYHRGQVVSLLRQLGSTPPSTDYLLFVFAQRGAIRT